MNADVTFHKFPFSAFVSFYCSCSFWHSSWLPSFLPSPPTSPLDTKDGTFCNCISDKRGIRIFHKRPHWLYGISTRFRDIERTIQSIVSKFDRLVS